MPKRIPEDQKLREGHYWVRIHRDIAMGRHWQIAWYHLSSTGRPVWSVIGLNYTYPHNAGVIVGPRLDPPAEE